MAADDADRDDQPSGKSKVGLSGFAALSMTEDTMGGGVPDEEEDFGGLMVRLYTSSSI